jgi:hypothetical protein
LCQSDVRFTLLHLVNIVMLVPKKKYIYCHASTRQLCWLYRTISFGFYEVNFLLLLLAVQFMQLNVTISGCILK